MDCKLIKKCCIFTPGLLKYIKKLTEENNQLQSDCDYYRSKSVSCELGLFQLQRENDKLKQRYKRVQYRVASAIQHRLSLMKDDLLKNKDRIEELQSLQKELKKELDL